MSDTEYELRLALAKRLPQMGQKRDRWARFWAKVLFLAVGLLLGAVLLWMAQNIAWSFIGQ